MLLEMKRTSNKDAGLYVSRKQEFKGSNTFGELNNNGYAVYSYGHHFPIYFYSNDMKQWFMNNEKYSVSTSKQQTQLHPNEECIGIDTKELKFLINK